MLPRRYLLVRERSIIYGLPGQDFRTGGQTLFWFLKKGENTFRLLKMGDKYFSVACEKGAGAFLGF